MLRRLIAYVAINIKNHNSWKYMKFAERTFCLERKEAKEVYDRTYYDLLEYAYKHTKYYRRIFDEINLFADGMLQKEKISEIPILTKEIIRNEKMNLVSDEANLRSAYSNTSGGSTGEPVEFFQDKGYFSKNFGDKLLFGRLNGKQPGDKEVKLWGSERDILEGSIGFKEKVINFCFNREFFNSFVLTQQNMEKYVNRINKIKPRQIWAYADSIYQLSKYINENKIKIYSPKNIITTAGVLYDEMRVEIQKAFPNTNVLNQYGSREAGVIACEVGDEPGLRIFEHSVRVEILNEDGNITQMGEGELLITNYTNYSMPLIRYQIGDTGIKNDNEGFKGNFAVLNKITGRTNTHLKKKDGSFIHGEYVTHLFYNKKWIENFKVIQHDYENIEFQIVIKQGMVANKEDLTKMKADLESVMGKCNLEINFLDSIPKLKSGKYQFVTCEI